MPTLPSSLFPLTKTLRNQNETSVRVTKHAIANVMLGVSRMRVEFRSYESSEGEVSVEVATKADNQKSESLLFRHVIRLNDNWWI